ncbi:transcriptional regulator [Ochrobactrum sp. 695/2009]|uniref:helix-turn-helix domain-containing protein n=2 Tax=Brucellaceae TaxID=118882 RepID=UPI000C291ED4|nr:helix-turn-helix transcriptional regulator [Brucella intermedia]MCI0998972.1 XRE family transcriptional regulator [Ochrobactrum sp. C6C9]PJR88877.1 transcriptional regulator [Ochrobactrum sp. 721/2009]PJT17066.1 transcriptional regulator [Ochrobactrum sp. 720/2009]PJT26770.1 transcriptional regulator [Ochrobactrum sp. 715/2009]PJT28666.1 transcriptional regulator [Ochrobactrum sp. 695/2009]PJT36337.1 transcriptional regulator [Ochrobactrum sp. 689/2009]
MDKNIPIVKGSGDVFADLGIQLTERDELKIAVAAEITKLIESRGLTQKEASEILGTDQAKVSNITRGRLSGFSLDRLLGFLIALGFNVDIHLSKNEGVHGKVTVHTPQKLACG